MPKSNRITVLIVDDIADTRDNLEKLLMFEKDVTVVGSAADGQQAIDLARKLAPDIIVMDINMPGLDGISAAEAIRAQGLRSQVIMMSVQEEHEALRRSMLAGAREFLVKPFGGEELALTIRRVYERADRLAASAAAPATAPEAAQVGRLIAIFSPKGGVGRTTIACNLAVALKLQRGKSVAMVDGSLPFGDVGVLMNISSSKTVVDLLPHLASLDGDLLHEFLLHHPSGVEVLLAPPRPEMAELVTPDSLKRILTKLRESYDRVVVDTAPSFDEFNLAVLDLADHIVVPLTLELPAMKNVRLFLEVARILGYPPEKILLVLNRANSTGGIDPREIEARLGQPIAVRLVSDGILATFALNQGMPFVMLNRTSALSRGVIELASLVDQGPAPAGAAPTPGPRRGAGARGGVLSRISLPWRKRPGVQLTQGAH